MASIEWLEQELATIDAAVILVAHDRWFLESVATSVLELEDGRSTFFPGKWHVWRQEKAARLANQAKWAERQAEDIARLERFVARFRYGTKSRQAQAKLKQIARIEAVRVEAPRGGRRTLGFEFLKPARSGRMVLEAEGFDLAAGTKPLLEDAELVLERGEHVALIGPNGSGKSTLLEAIVGRRLGRIGHGVELAYFSQHEVELDERGSVLECTMGATGLQRAQAQALLGRFLFSGWDDHEKPVVALSGGERRRLALALSSPRARTSSSSTSRRTTSTSRAASRSRPRSRPFRGRCCSSRTTAPCSTRSPSGSSPSRTARCARTRAAGPTTSRIRADEDAPPPPAPKERKEKARPERPRAAAAERARADRDLDPGARARARGARAAARRGLGRRRDARGAQGRPRRAAGPARALGAAVRVRAAGVTL